MPARNGFDNEKYLAEQTQAILERAEQFDHKLYLEFGGKLMFDYHAARVLPGYDPNVKMRLLQKLKDKAELVLCIYAGDIERKKMRADFGITYDSDALKMIDDCRAWGIHVAAVVITRYEEQPSARLFKDRLERRGIRVHTHRRIQGYPANLDLIVSPAGYGANEPVETTKPIVVVTGPGPGSGKLSTALCLMYHEHVKGNNAGYAKFETFPIWNLPLTHPVNVAYEAATADLADCNQIDPFHLEAYGKTTINYNRDIDAFPVVRKILKRITSRVIYKSPTDMGVNRAGFGIIDDDAVRDAAKQEVVRRYFRYACEYSMGLATQETVKRAELIMNEIDVSPVIRPVVAAARQAATDAETAGKGNQGIYCGGALELRDGRIVTGKNSSLMHAASSLILNAIKELAGIPDKVHLLPPSIIESIGRMKKDVLSMKQLSLNLEETLIALSISAASNPSAGLGIEQLRALDGCEVHVTHIPTPGDEAGLRRLGVNLTSDPNFSSKDLFVS